jgi:hypothetical protein
MKLVAMSGGEFRVLDDFDLAKLSEIKLDFFWVDIDKEDPATTLALKSLYGVESINPPGYPLISRHYKYDLIAVDYYAELTKKELQILLADKCVITIHQGPDEVCNEVIASINEMLVSGGLNSESVLLGIFSSILRYHNQRVRVAQESLRNMDLSLKVGVTNAMSLSQLNGSLKEMSRVIYSTHSLLADIMLKTVPLRGIKDPMIFSDVYSALGGVSKLADYLSEMADGYAQQLTPFVWNQLISIKRSALGLSLLAISISAAAIFNMLFPNALLGIGIDNIYITIAFIAVGALGFVAAQGSPRFKPI